MNSKQTAQMAFHGSGSEYFRIWVVNLLLTIVTLGFYTPWAKVRTNRYFYAQTELAGSRFEYHAKPIDLLKGYLIFFGAFLLYGFLSSAVPATGPVFILIAMAAAPWLIAASMRFRLNATSYRGIRFAFHGSAKKAYKLFGLYVVLAGLPIFLITALGLSAEEFQPSEPEAVMELREDRSQLDSNGSLASPSEPIFAGDGREEDPSQGGLQQFGGEEYSVYGGQVTDSLEYDEEAEREAARAAMEQLAHQGLLGLLVLLLMPVMFFMFLFLNWHIRKTFLNWAGFGSTRFECEARFKPVLKSYFITTVLGSVLSGIWFAIGSLLGTLLATLFDAGADANPTALESMDPTALAAGVGLSVIIGAVLFLLPFVLIYFYVTVRFKKEMYESILKATQFGGNVVKLDLNTFRVSKVMFVNLLLTVLTLGFYHPFAKVRLTQEILQGISVDFEQGPDAFAAGEKRKSGATGEMLADGFDLGFSI